MKRTLQALIACTVLASPNLLAHNDRFKNVTIEPVKVSENTYMFIGAGGNIGVSAGKDGLLIIDDQFAPLAEKVAKALNDIQPGHPRFVINTHYHGDHTGGNAHFGQHGTIMAHHNVLKRLSADPKVLPEALPVVTYDQGISIHYNNDTLDIIHLGAGHTDGDSIVLWRDKSVVHMGDLFFKDRFPYVDLDAGGTVKGYRDNVATILGRIKDDTKIIPGHGELATKAELLTFKRMLDDSIEWMQSNLDKNRTLADIKKQGVPKEWEDWGWQFISEDRWIETLYRDLS
ncbi:MBL fold metallo-hydrolase [Endozoicomonas arenosclerae]|uniref:MBL fold metallo-hydrolase n=1 Tax=Endozoicomonas arenosclerae TaxID=1633495 RepID=UPI000A445EA7|nr:MBL fold metallo-hydrolase [Endozoicomonas arenosclerae]